MAINESTIQSAAKARAALSANNGSKTLGDILVLQNVITSRQLEEAQNRQKDGPDSKLPIGTILIKLGFATEEDITRARAQQMNIAYVSPEMLANAASLGAEVIGTIPAEIAISNLLLPVGRSSDGQALRVVSSNWTNASYEAAKMAAAALDLGIEAMLGSEKYVRPAVAYHYNKGGNTIVQPPRLAPLGNRPPTGGPLGRSSVPATLGSSAVPATIDDPSALPARVASNLKASDVLMAARKTTGGGQDTINRNSNGDVEVDIQDFSVDQPVVIQFVNKIIAEAIQKRASDIHLEPLRDNLEVKYRIDGALHSVDVVQKQFQNACTSRIKVMADMNIAERRIPQDGRISVTLKGRQVDLRVSSLPTQYGEAVVMRILDRNSMKLSIDGLGFSERNLRTLKQIISKPHGIFLATGPTGSGKTTTLYSALHAIKAPDINIITVEDPIEYELDGVRQSNTNEKAGLTFARQLRAILRQDPDVIYVGEIRDPETAEIAFRAALTGHLVFSTLHCNDAAGAVTRLLNMGMDPFLIASSVIGVLAQRLVRRVCPNCSASYEPRPEELASLGIDSKIDDLSGANFQSGTGCAECDRSGFKGRFSVQELMLMDDSVRQLTLERSTSTKIRLAAMASSNPMIPLRRDAAFKVMQGITTAEEVQRRVFLEEE